MIFYGDIPVPWVASWSDENQFFLEPCPYARAIAICQNDAQGLGKPQFGKPHSGRQRRAIATGLCDTCGRPLAARTKVSLSHARPQAHGHQIGDILQVEPLMHRECAAISVRHCPSLKRDIALGSLRVRQVTRYQVQFAVMDEIYTNQMTGEFRKAIGHAKVQLITWCDRDQDWLSRA